MNNERRLIECVPNFSEGRKMDVINQITSAIQSVEGICVLNVDPGATTNRTVVTFVGEPQAVVEAAFLGVQKAAELIDMRQHHGAHPRLGATDVLPLVPISGVTLEECAQLARHLAKRIADELSVPCYCYEAAALRPNRTNLAVCRSGEYESLAEKFTTPGLEPDFMPPSLTVGPDGSLPEQVLRTGCTIVGARDYLIAVNFNLNSTSTRRASAIACDVREIGRPLREGNSPTGNIVRDAQGNAVMSPGRLKCTKALGWYIDEYGIAQVSMNITNIAVTPLHVAFDEVCMAAFDRGIRVTGTEIIGLVPRKTLIDAGKYFLEKQQRSVGIPEEDIIKIAVKSMGLDDLRPFNPRERVIEYLLEDMEKRQSTSHAPHTTALSLKAFADEVSRESPAPGGGGAAIYLGALAAALGTMVANVSAHKPAWDDRWEEFSQWAVMGQQMMKQLLDELDNDALVARQLKAASTLPGHTEEERLARETALQEAILTAAQTSLHAMHAAMQVFVICRAMAKECAPDFVSEAGVGALAARAAVRGAGLIVKSRASQLKDYMLAGELVAKANDLIKRADSAEHDILDIVEQRL